MVCQFFLKPIFLMQFSQWPVEPSKDFWVEQKGSYQGDLQIATIHQILFQTIRANLLVAAIDDCICDRM